MEEKRQMYILLEDRRGERTERGLLHLKSKSVETQFIRGQIFRTLPETEQPEDSNKIALVETTSENFKLVCATTEVARITEEEAKLLSAIVSAEERHRIFRERNRLGFGIAIKNGTKVLVKVKTAGGVHRDVPGVVWFKGPLPTHDGTMFGVELTPNKPKGSEQLGTSDGTFREKRYFTCPENCGVFVALDKIQPQDNTDTKKSPQRETASSKSRLSIFKDAVFPSKEHNRSKFDYQLKIGERVVTFKDDRELRGVVCYIANEPDDSDMIAVGIELDERYGNGTGLFRSRQRFMCKKDYALFVPADTVIPEKDFDEKPQKKISTGSASAREVQPSSSLGYDVNSSKDKSQGIKRSSSASSLKHTTSEEAIKIASRHGDSSDKDKVVKEQESILAKIKAEQKQSNRSNEIVDVGLPINEDHYSDKHDQSVAGYIPVQSGKSNFCVSPEDMISTLSHPGADIKQPVSSSQAISRGSSQTPVLPPNRPSTRSTHNDLGNYHNRNAEFYEELPNHVMDRDQGTELDKEGLLLMEQADSQLGKGMVAPSDYHEDDVALGLEVGCMAEVPLVNNQPRYGVIRWIGQLAELKNKLVAGLELEEEQSGCSDGTFKGKRYFECPPGRGFFVLLKYCRKDSRFELDSPMDTPGRSAKNFGSMDCPSIEGIIPPPPSLPEQSTGMMRGIQGHHNSCYLDSTLYSMFAFTTVFDTLLHRERQSSDLEDYDKVQKVLKEEIVNPLRRNGFVRADRVLKLRRLLDKLGSTSGLTDEEKDPEEFLNTLLHQVLKSESLLQLKSHGRCEESNYYQIITEKDEGIKLATVQTLIEQSFMAADLKLAEVPSCLILQMPRFGNKYKMYDIIFPNTTLDITDILDNVPRPCVLCGEQASTFECKECYEEKIFSIGITSFCRDCCKKVHSHPRRTSHKLTPIIVPREYSQYARRDGPLERYTMELFAVVCIQTSHYVAFVKCGQGPDAPWCFFDSMADRKGESNGYNIPAVRACPEASRWLLAKPDEIIGANRRGELPGNMKRLFGDAYMCMYQNFDTAMYK